MVKRAVLVGCNYPGTNSQLHGCVNDVTNMRKVLTEVYGFDKKNIVFMVDTDATSTAIRPTGRNVVAQLSKAIELSKAGDVLYFHFSGHGGQIPAESGDVEDDGADEAIYPTDLNPLTDDSFRVILSKLDPGVNFTFVSDSCNSGGLLDTQQLRIGVGELGEVGAETESTRDHAITSGPVKGRQLSVENLTKELAEKSGHEVQVGNIRTTVYELFQEDASPTVKVFVKKLLERVESGTPQEKWGETYSEVGVKALSQLKQVWDDDKINNDEYFASAKSVSGPVSFSGHANAKPAAEEVLPPSTATLVSGCESDQLSADVPGVNGAYGALSNAVEQVVRRNKGKVTNKRLVNDVRAIMVRTRMDQRPCLYCTADKVSSNFISDL